MNIELNKMASILAVNNEKPKTKKPPLRSTPQSINNQIRNLANPFKR